MIFDKIENISRYNLDLSLINQVLEKGIYKKGRFNIDEPNCFGIGLEYETKDASDALWEAHRKYLDIHCVLQGEEIVEISDIMSMNPTNNYEEDYQLFDGQADQQLILNSKNFLILFSNEVHKTGIRVNNPENVKKIVFKLKIVD